MLVTKQLTLAIDIHSVEKYYGSQWLLLTHISMEQFEGE